MTQSFALSVTAKGTRLPHREAAMVTDTAVSDRRICGPGSAAPANVRHEPARLKLGHGSRLSEIGNNLAREHAKRAIGKEVQVVGSAP
jgi:hypothetical protein